MEKHLNNANATCLIQDVQFAMDMIPLRRPEIALERISRCASDHIIGYIIHNRGNDADDLAVCDSLMEAGNLANSLCNPWLAIGCYSTVLDSFSPNSNETAEKQHIFLRCLRLFVLTSNFIPEFHDVVDHRRSLNKLRSAWAWRKLYVEDRPDLEFKQTLWHLLVATGAHLRDCQLATLAVEAFDTATDILARLVRSHPETAPVAERLIFSPEGAWMRYNWGQALIDIDDHQGGRHMLAQAVQVYLSLQSRPYGLAQKAQACKSYMKEMFSQRIFEDWLIPHVHECLRLTDRVQIIVQSEQNLNRTEVRESELREELINAQHILQHSSQASLEIAQMFCELGYVCYYAENDQLTMDYLRLGVQAMTSQWKQKSRALRIVGLAAFNLKRYEESATAHLQCIDYIQRHQRSSVCRGGVTAPPDVHSQNVIAECHCNIASCHMMRRDVTGALRHYEAALQMAEHLAPEERAEAEISVGNLRHIQAARLRGSDVTDPAQVEALLTHARETLEDCCARYERCWAHVNLALLRIYVTDYAHALQSLRQIEGLAARSEEERHKGVVLDELDTPILPAELGRHLVAGREMHVPYPVMSLYLQGHVYSLTGDGQAQARVAGRLHTAVKEYDYEEYNNVEAVTSQGLRGTCMTLVGHSYLRLGQPGLARQAYLEARALMPDSACLEECLADCDSEKDGDSAVADCHMSDAH